MRKKSKSSDCAPNWLTGVTPCDAMWSFFRPDNAYDCIFRTISKGKDDHYARLEKTTFIFMLLKADCGLTAAQIQVVIPKRCFPKRLSNTFLTLLKKKSESGVSQKKKPSVSLGTDGWFRDSDFRNSKGLFNCRKSFCNGDFLTYFYTFLTLFLTLH